jgi:hypothetical protein
MSGGQCLRLTGVERPANKPIPGFVHEDFLVLDIGRLYRRVIDSPELLKLQAIWGGQMGESIS